MEKKYGSILVYCLMLAAACTMSVYHKTADIKKSFSQFEAQIGSFLNKVGTDLQEKEAIYKHLTSYAADTKADPYPRLEETVKEMQGIYVSLQKNHNRFKELKNELDAITKGKGKIKGNTPEWEKVSTIKQESEKISKEIETAATQYLTPSERFVTICGQHKIAKVNVLEINKQVYTYIGNLDRSINEIETGITNNRKRLATEDSKKLSEKKRQEMSGILNQLEGIKNVVAQKRYQIENLINEFKREAGGKDQVWAGPGMRIHTITNDIQQIGNDIMNLNMQFKNVLRLFDIIEKKK